MDFLPKELFSLIVRKCKIRDIINIKRVCKQYNIDLDNEVLEKAKGNNKLKYHNLYVKYTFNTFSKTKPDNIPFKLSNSEYILYQGFTQDNFIERIRIITINDDKKYVQYIFSSFKYIGYNKYILMETIQYNTLNGLFFGLRTCKTYNVINRHILKK
jgi:hypothetical protein